MIFGFQRSLGPLEIPLGRLGAGPKAKPSLRPKTASEGRFQASPLPWGPGMEGGGADCLQDTVTAAPLAPRGSTCWSHRGVEGGNWRSDVAARKRHPISKEALGWKWLLAMSSGVRNPSSQRPPYHLQSRQTKADSLGRHRSPPDSWAAFSPCGAATEVNSNFGHLRFYLLWDSLSSCPPSPPNTMFPYAKN